ncbi:MAG: hypothetical protein EOM05_05450 [Clostridia bacterium]|nr:hypothetical protein [Clostridia bacterium]
MQSRFESLREEYKTFIYNGYKLSQGDGFIEVEYDFEMGDIKFAPTTKIRTQNLNIVNDYDSDMAKNIIFSLGMVELVSYWKCACPPQIIVRCGELSENDCNWWKKLYYNGLGEFFYKNGIQTDFDSFVRIDAKEKIREVLYPFKKSGKNIVPVGGGKDSVVTMELLKQCKDDNYCFTVNDQPAREECANAAGYGDDRIIKTYRKIDDELLRLNSQGFLNGHTPFSAIVAFLGLYCAYLIGGEYIVLSNESSANEGNIEGTEINHQYSKSFEFECDFNSYVKKNITKDIKYFSLLRAFNELQIAKQFSALSKFHSVFKSCNVGSKKNIWCANCAKCLFVYIILSPFLSQEDLIKIFGENLLDKEELKDIFDGLVGFSSVKPFECIGTKGEINAALAKTCENIKISHQDLPLLLEYYGKKVDNLSSVEFNILIEDFNNENNAPQKFKTYLREMYDYVASV